MTIDELPRHQPAKVKAVKPHELAAKLTDMGLYEGKEITVMFKAPFGGPIALNIDGYLLSLRRFEASLVEVV